MNDVVVVARSSQSGVWIGRETGRQILDSGIVVELEGALRIWSWDGALSCSAIAASGISGGKVDVPVTVTVHGCCEVIESSEQVRTSVFSHVSK